MTERFDDPRKTEEAHRSESTELDLSGQGITKLSVSLGQLDQLRMLNLSGNLLVKLPESFLQLTQLQELDLSRNVLVELPGWFSQLRQLERLYLDDALLELPESLGQLDQLRILSLSKNQLTELPESISQLSQLQCLDLSDNQLAELPESIRNLKKLEELYLHGNEAIGLPKEVLGPTRVDAIRDDVTPAKPADILDYYFLTRDGQRPLNEAKLILVGRGEVGKTSLVNRLVHDRFDPDEGKTEGIQITEWPLVLNEDEDVQLHIWDFGGQEIMHATHQFFLTQRSLYLLVLSGRGGTEDADAEYWLRLIDSFGGDSPVIVVLNKINQHAFDLARRALKRKYPQVRAFVRTDCEDGTGIDELRHVIERETDRLDSLRDAFPASWFAIKDKLAGMEENYLDFRDYQTLCEGHGEADAAAQESLARYLHRLGVALNYKQDPRLQDTHVLNPRWVTNGVYRLLNSKKLEAQKGEVRLQDLKEILDADAYPRHMRRFLFDLMKKFDLCFSFPEDEFRYLVPELLDKQEPEAVDDFEAAACLSFQYHYPVLPQGLLPRFIVRKHRLSEGLPRWRSGVILQFEGNRALVRADVQDKKVFIEVDGPMSGRRRLLAVIRSELEQIHGAIRNLKPEAMIPLPEHPEVTVPYEELFVREEKGKLEFTEVVGGEVIDLNARDLLNGVDLEGERRRGRGERMHRGAVRLFISYSHKDEELRERLQTHLTILKRQGLIDAWDDRRISPGDEWEREIDQNLERADIVLLLISADFIASDYCYKREMARAGAA